MGTRETRLDRGRRRGERLVRELMGQLVSRRESLNISQRTLAADLGCSQSEVWRLEHLVRVNDVSLVRMCELASLLGLELGASLHLIGDPVRDKGHVALLSRLCALLADAFRVMYEAPLPLPGDRRSWDLLLRHPEQLIGIEAETRIRDMQYLVRHVRERERDGGVDEIVLLLAESTANRRMLSSLREMLGDRFATPPRGILAALRSGSRVPGSGVVLL